MPCSEKRARKLLEARRARVARLYPFTIRLVDLYVEDCALQPMRLSLDPGSKTTGLALSRIETQVNVEAGEISEPVMHIAFLMELTHRGAQIKKALTGRAALRRRRRGRNLRYRPGSTTGRGPRAGLRPASSTACAPPRRGCGGSSGSRR